MPRPRLILGEKCINGHDLTIWNLVTLKNGDLRCRDCAREHTRKALLKKKELGINATANVTDFRKWEETPDD